MSALDTLEHVQTIAFLGANSTAARGQAFDWIGELKGRPRNAGLAMHHLGHGGELVADTLDALPEVTVLQPTKVVVFAGLNDILAGVSDKVRRFFTATPEGEAPSVAAFQDNLTTLVRRLKAKTDARIALCSLPPIGEARDADEPLQRRLNAQVEQYSALIAHIAYSEGCAYIPLYEAFLVHLKPAPGRAFAALRVLPFYMDAFRSVVLRQDADAIAARNGWHLHSDGIHLNRRGGMIAADLVQRFLDL